MKKICIFLFLTALLLTGCKTGKAPETPYAVITDNRGEMVALTVDTAAGTITHQDDVYRYSVEDSAVTIHYPDGCCFTRDNRENQGRYFYEDSGPDAIINRPDYLDGELLAGIIADNIPEELGFNEENIALIFLGLVTAALGIFPTFFPHRCWKLRYGWAYENPEPSTLGLVITKLSGVLLMLSGVVITIIGCFK